MVCSHTGKRINLCLAELGEHIDLARAVEAKVASRCGAQGRITQPKSFAVELGRESIAARTQADAGKDKALLDYLDQWVICNEKQGFKWFTFAFDTNKTAREQIKAEMDLAATKPENK